MKKSKFFKIIVMMISTVFIAMCFPITARADIGPKHSVFVYFENMGIEECYGTLLSEHMGSGFYHVWDGDEEHIDNHNLDLEIWRAFVEYEDTDGYYFLQIAWKVSDTKRIGWVYCPPYRFKILLYYPETKRFVVSGIYEKYAFDTYYTVDMSGVNIDSAEYNDHIDAYPSYNYVREILFLVIRIIITIAIEMAVALWYFGFRNKKQLLVLVWVNVVTQIILNVLLNVINYKSGPRAFVLYYIQFEIIVVALEAVLYCTILKKVSDRPEKNGEYILYALVANAVSFGTGVVVSPFLL